MTHLQLEVLGHNCAKHSRMDSIAVELEDCRGDLKVILQVCLIHWLEKCCGGDGVKSIDGDICQVHEIC